MSEGNLYDMGVSPGENVEELAMVVVACSRCEKDYEEFKVIADWIQTHPARLPRCIRCDPLAEKRAWVRVVV